MDKHYYNPENIEAFIGNKLSMSEKLKFENAIAKDPLLKNEVDLQQDIIESLKKARKAELKARLNAIDVSSAPTFTGVKIAASVIVTGLLSYGIYSYFVSSESTNNKPAATAIEVNTSKPESKETTSAADKIIITETAVDNKSNSQLSENNSSVSNKKHTSNANPAPITVPEPVEVENEQFQQDESINIPEGKIAQEASIKNNLDIKEDNSTSNKFHYKFYNNKLFLFGNFSEKTYEILELNTYKGKQVYLYYDNNYYLLKSNQLETTPLKKITDKKVLAEIEKLGK